jgi:hypothetical protein
LASFCIFLKHPDLGFSRNKSALPLSTDDYPKRATLKAFG